MFENAKKRMDYDRKIRGGCVIVIMPEGKCDSKMTPVKMTDYTVRRYGK